MKYKNSKLYKYLDVHGGLKMLQNSNLRFTNSTRLNDPFDCHPALFDFSKPPVNAYNWPPADFLMEKGITDMENLRRRAWVCSFSRVYDSLLMWAYYGNHKGVCIGLDMEKAYRYLSRLYCTIYMGAMEMKVQYRDVIEKPDYFQGVTDYFHYLLSTKAKSWKHEKEVRLVLIDPSPGFIPNTLPYKPKKGAVIPWEEVLFFPNIGRECFESLYLGIKMSDEEKEKIIKEARECNPDIRIYQMAVDPDAFRLKEEFL